MGEGVLLADLLVVLDRDPGLVAAAGVYVPMKANTFDVIFDRNRRGEGWGAGVMRLETTVLLFAVVELSFG